MSFAQLARGGSGEDVLTADTPRYLLAKYIPDILRDEPRNIGIIVWSPTGVASRFLGEFGGRLDLRRVPTFVNTSTAYVQWIQYWRSQLDRDEIRPVAGGPPIPRTNPLFLEALQSANTGNYHLELAGGILDGVEVIDLEGATDQLFELLVTTDTEEEVEVKQSQMRLARKCAEVLKSSGVEHHENFTKNYPVDCKLRYRDDIRKEIKFSYGFGNGLPKFLYQLVPLSSKGTELMRTVRASARMFEQVIDNYQIDPRTGLRALVYASDSRLKSGEIQEAITTIKPYATVLNLARQAAILAEEFNRLKDQPPLPHEGDLFTTVAAS